MPAPVFTTSLPKQNFELIRDQLAVILATEFAGQYAIDNTYPNITKVWVERFIPFNSETDLPTININLAKGEWGNKNLVKAQGEYYYNIDIYTAAPTNNATGPGDQYSMAVMNKIAGMVWQILSNPAYKTLLLNQMPLNGLPTVERFFVADRGMVKDALSDVVGRVQVCIKATENTVDVSSPVELKEMTTKVMLSTSNFGYYYDYKLLKITLTATGATLTNAFFSNTIMQIIYNGITYVSGTDFTQAGTTITAITFTFTNGKTLIATT